MALSLQNQKLVWTCSFSSKQPSQVKNKGKWLAFIPISYADSVWKHIDLATKQDKLGYYSKISTPLVLEKRKKIVCVLCIYTYDCHDAQDVLRVREELRNLGFTRKIPYKCKEMYCE